MTRDVSIPLLLWVSAAMVLHLVGGGGVVGATVVEERHRAERAEIRAMVQSLRQDLGVVALELVDVADPEANPMEAEVRTEPRAPNPDDPGTDEEGERDDVAPSPDPEKKKAPEPVATKPVPTPSEPDEAAKPAPSEPLPPEPAVEPPPVAPPPLPLELPKDQRIAIRQAAEPNQQDNPDAPRIADEANRVEEETIAKIRASDSVARDPSLAPSTKSPDDSAGDSTDDKPGDSRDREGDARKAPGEAVAANDATPRSPGKQEPAQASVPTGGDDGRRAAAAGGQDASNLPPAEAAKGALGGDSAPSPDVVQGAEGWSLDPANPGGTGGRGEAGVAKLARRGVESVQTPKGGFGGSGLPGGLPMLSWKGFEAAVGPEGLRAQREAMGKAIRARHRGRYDTNKFQRWLPDIENYEPTVKLGNQTALNAARVPFASYLNSIHNRIHPIFAEEFLMHLERLAGGHALNDELVTHVEIVLANDDGRVLRMGVTRNSGSTMFDAAALEAVDRAAPYGKPPVEIVSVDGKVYLHWEFHRDPVDACSTRNARPYLLRDAPEQPAAPRHRPSRQRPPRYEDPKPAPPLPLRMVP